MSAEKLEKRRAELTRLLQQQTARAQQLDAELGQLKQLILVNRGRLQEVIDLLEPEDASEEGDG